HAKGSLHTKGPFQGGTPRTLPGAVAPTGALSQRQRCSMGPLRCGEDSPGVDQQKRRPRSLVRVTLMAIPRVSQETSRAPAANGGGTRWGPCARGCGAIRALPGRAPPLGALPGVSVPPGALQRVGTHPGALPGEVAHPGALPGAVAPRGALLEAPVPPWDLSGVVAPPGAHEGETSPPGARQGVTSHLGAFLRGSNAPRGSCRSSGAPRGG
ncbi:collagen alpha-1(XVII) chain-like, partial [Homarus americanus]|uniref:collagen alpha-1(XVII) chain-like n=1 Tax=Homarus americanus TaxID=6706 RepID=UPI001C44A5F0